MTQVRALTVAMPSEQAFRPFGQLIGAPARAPDFTGGSGTRIWDMNCEIDGTLQLGFLRVPYQPLAFSLMEQHFGVMQTFIPLGGPPAVAAFAAPTPRGTAPRPEDVRAFLLDGRTGYVLHRNTWHALDRFPLYPGQPGDWVILTDRETTADLQASGPAQGGDKLTRTIDFAELYGVRFEFDLAAVGPEAG